MSDHQHRGGKPRMPIDRRVGFLDTILADALDWYVAHPLHKPWQGGEKGDPYMLDESHHNHQRVDEAAQAFLSDLQKAIGNFHVRMCAIRGHFNSDGRYREEGEADEVLLGIKQPSDGMVLLETLEEFLWSGLSSTERRILAALSQSPGGRTKVQIAILAMVGYPVIRTDEAIPALRSKGYIDGSSTIAITQTGLAALGPGPFDGWETSASPSAPS